MMQNFVTISLLIVCVVIGYFIHPMIIQDTADDAAINVAEDEREQLSVSSQSILKKITAEDFPESVSLKKDFIMYDAESETEIKLDVGMKVKPIRVMGNELFFQLLDQPMGSKIAITKTNFIELAALRIKMRNTKDLAVGKPVQDDVSTESEKEVSKPTKDQSEVPPPVVKIDPVEAPPAASPTAQYSSIKLDKSAAIEVVKANILAGGVKEFKANQVNKHSFTDDFEYDGKNYQAVRINYTAETILGAQEHEALALLSGGKVSLWIWAKTQLEME